MPSKTTAFGVAAGALIALLPFLGSEPVSWPRAAVVLGVAACIALVGVFARDASPPAPPPGLGT